jgi:alpha-L-fucosidase
MPPKPTSLQPRWQEQEFGMFCHFGINTFYGKEWSNGTLSPAAFDPTRLDARQWVQTALAAGMRYLIFTAKHHDGFCLWPTETTDYSVKSSPYQNGRGDVVGEIALACQEAGLHFGIYLSPWDRHESCYPNAKAYDDFYIRQLTELCTRYGPLFELWFDGAGSEGRVYDWPRIMNVADRYQPQAAVFNMGKPTVRWVGNEDGLAADPNFYVVDGQYLPPECDVPIRQNWFWQSDDLQTLKSVEHLQAIYYRSVGYGANLLLNVPPANTGLLDSRDCARLLEFTQALRQRFANPIPGTLQQEGATVHISFEDSVSLDHLILQEHLNDGQIVDGYQIYVGEKLITQGRTIGHKKIDAFPIVQAQHIRIELSTPTARLSRLTAFRTGYESLPEIGTPEIDEQRGERIG